MYWAPSCTVRQYKGINSLNIIDYFGGRSRVTAHDIIIHTAL